MTSTREDQAKILAQCLDELQEGSLTVDSCLNSRPQYRGEMEEILHLAASLNGLPRIVPSDAFRLQARKRLLARISQKQGSLSWPAKSSPRPMWSLQRLFVPVLTACFLLVCLFGGGVGVVVAAENSLPGDAFHGLERAIESIQLSLTPSATDRMTLALGFAEERLKELEKLIEGNAQEAFIQQAVAEYEDAVETTSGIYSAAEIPDSREGLRNRFEKNLTDNIQVLDDLRIKADGKDDSTINKAIDLSKKDKIKLEKEQRRVQHRKPVNERGKTPGNDHAKTPDKHPNNSSNNSSSKKEKKP